MKFDVRRFSKSWRENSSFDKIRQEQRTLYIKTYVHLWQYLSDFFSKWEMFQTDIVEKIKTHILCLITFSRKSCRLWDNAEKCGRAGEATDDIIIIRRMRNACWINKATDRIFHTYCVFTATMVSGTRLSALLYVHCLSCPLSHINNKAFRKRLYQRSD
jgi:hypothetical protein